MHDRIDWVLVAGPAKTVTSGILGESGFADTTVAVDPFPSDHRGVVSTFTVEPATTPTLVSIDRRRLYVGDELAVRAHAPDGEGAQVVVVPAGTVRATPAKTGPSARTARYKLTTAGLAAGAYDVVLLSSSGDVLARAPFWLYRPERSRR